MSKGEQEMEGNRYKAPWRCRETFVFILYFRFFSMKYAKYSLSRHVTSRFSKEQMSFFQHTPDLCSRRTWAHTSHSPPGSPADVPCSQSHRHSSPRSNRILQNTRFNDLQNKPLKFSQQTHTNDTNISQQTHQWSPAFSYRLTLTNMLTPQFSASTGQTLTFF